MNFQFLPVLFEKEKYLPIRKMNSFSFRCNHRLYLCCNENSVSKKIKYHNWIATRFMLLYSKFRTKSETTKKYKYDFLFFRFTASLYSQSIEKSETT